MSNMAENTNKTLWSRFEVLQGLESAKNELIQVQRLCSNVNEGILADAN